MSFPDTRKAYCFDAFSRIGKKAKVTSLILVIHSTEHEIINLSHGLAMYECCSWDVETLWVKEPGLRDTELYAQYLEILKEFISHKLPNS
uniref:Uncharacterized protein n=1 Tax=Catagonus wagneri TaxID=51154 RepID=A0A8C3VHI0_9CETA